MRLRIYDPYVFMAQLTGANRRYIEQELPHIGNLLTGDFADVLAHTKVAIVGCAKHCKLDELTRWARTGTLIDLDRVPESVARAASTYHGLSW